MITKISRKKCHSICNNDYLHKYFITNSLWSTKMHYQLTYNSWIRYKVQLTCIGSRYKKKFQWKWTNLSICTFYQPTQPEILHCISVNNRNSLIYKHILGPIITHERTEELVPSTCIITSFINEIIKDRNISKVRVF